VLLKWLWSPQVPGCGRGPCRDIRICNMPGSGLRVRVRVCRPAHNKSTKWLLQLLSEELSCCCSPCHSTKLGKSFRIKKLDVRISQKLPPHYIESWFWGCPGLAHCSTAGQTPPNSPSPPNHLVIQLSHFQRLRLSLGFLVWLQLLLFSA